MTTVVALSDTHGFERCLQVPDGDLLVHAGDVCRHGRLSDLLEFLAWFAALPHAHKILVAGNHDRVLQEQERSQALAAIQAAGVIYLEDSVATVAGFTVFGSPWTSLFMDWSFMLPANELAAKWQAIPAQTDILLTHSPPYGIMDMVRGQALGCPALLAAVQRIQPRIHVFGHIHEFGDQHTSGNTLYVNASVLDAQFKPSRAVQVVELA